LYVKLVGKYLIWIILLVLMVGLGWWGWHKFWPMVSPLGQEKSVSLSNIDYTRYDFDSLKDKWQRGKFEGREIDIGEEIEAINLRRSNLGYKTDFDTRVFKFWSGGKQISGMINWRPWESKKSSVVIMVRGYAEKQGYYPGFGIWRVADELAKAGFVTISIDFLGYGESDGESLDMLEARFEKVENMLDLLASIKKLGFVDTDNISFWAHSNGGQIVLSVLEITGEKYPTVLWAPMTNPFPASVLETIDEGSPVKAEIEKFSKKYDTRRYGFENYYEWIESPVLIIQGDNDVWCEIGWQERVVSSLIDLGKEVELLIMPGADHNMVGKWNEATTKTLDFFEKRL